MNNEQAVTSKQIAEVHRNELHNGVEVHFAEKPDRAVIDRLKAAGFRFHFVKKFWFKKYGAYAWAQAHTIAGIPLPGELPGDQRIPVEQSQGVDRFDAAIV